MAQPILQELRCLKETIILHLIFQTFQNSLLLFLWMENLYEELSKTFMPSCTELSTQSPNALLQG